MSFNDIFKKGFLDVFNTKADTTINIYNILFAFFAALLIGLFIYFVYKFTFGGVMYSRNFNISLFGLTIISTFIILAISSNVVLSLGMVGALSIVRFRTAIKNPMDLVFLFWAIGAGIVTGAQAYALAILGSLIVGAVVFFTSQNFSLFKISSPYLVIINCDIQTSEKSCIEIINKHAQKSKLKSKIVSTGKGIEMIYEIRSKADNTEFINELSALEGVQNASLVSYNGEFLD
jgi:uncharacterized membrane protein YhiD involved in acid resistance